MIDLLNIFADSPKKATAEMQSNESYENIKEQKNINTEEDITDDFSFESSFVQSLEDDEGGNDEDALNEADDDFGDSMDDMGGDDDFGGDGGDDFGGGDDDSGGGTGGNNGSAGGVDDLDLNKGSSLNAYTQVNQKLYHIAQLNKLLGSIKTTISRYNDLYTDWSELNQLKDLADIVDEERNSFVMQENPENLIKLRLYQEQYANIVNRLAILIEKKAKNKDS